MAEKQRKSKQRPSVRFNWSKEQIRALRVHMDLTQREMADELEVRQQTISEWETGTHQPHRTTLRILSMIAEQAHFTYQVSEKPADAPPDDIPTGD